MFYLRYLVCILPVIIILDRGFAANNSFEQGMSHYRARRFDQAIKKFEYTIDLFPNHAEAYNYLGESLYEMGSYIQAIKSFKKALQIKPSYGRAEVNLLVTRWKLPPSVKPPPLEGWPEVRLQLISGYTIAIGAAVLSYLGGNLIGAKNQEGIVPYEVGAIGLTVGSIEQIYLLGEELGYGGGQRINVIAGAVFCPLIGSIIYSKILQVGQTGYLRGAAYGSLLAPIGAIVGYHLSKNSLF